MSLILLLQIDAKIEEEDKVILLLCFQPPSYKHFGETFLFGREILSIEDVKSSLPCKEQMDM